MSKHQNGRLQKNPTSRDVARLADVSQSAVSRAFTPGGRIGEDARRKVIAAADSLGYRPNLNARSLITAKSYTVGMAVGYMDNQFYPAVLERVSKTLEAAGYRLLLLTSGREGDVDPVLEEVLRYRLDAVLLASAKISSRFADECEAENIPVVMLNRRTESAHVSSVVGDNVRGAQDIARLLMAGGHQRFAYVAGLEESSTSIEREQGFAGALAAAGKGPPRRVSGRYDFEAACAAARHLFQRPDRPDAVFCANDHMAFAVLQTARYEFGLDVGREVSIVGFDDVSLAAWPAFDLTTYTQSVEQMADRAVEVVLRHLGDPDAPAVQIITPGRLVLRRSARLPTGFQVEFPE